MHVKTDSEVTSLAASSPPRSPRRPIYFVMSPSQPDAEKLSLGGYSPGASPVHNHRHHLRYSSSPIHHSRESTSTTRFSAPLKNPGPWRKIPHSGHVIAAGDDADADDDEDAEDHRRGPFFYSALFLIGFTVLFTVFSLILWGASKAYRPSVRVEGVVFTRYNVQAGMDRTGVPTKMLSMNSTVRMRFRNRATFFGVHVSSTSLEMYYYDLIIASGTMKEFYQDRKSGRLVTTVVGSTEVPLYGGGLGLTSRGEGGVAAAVPVNLTFVVRSRAHVLGELVRSKFYCHIRCGLMLWEDRLGRAASIRNACEYHGCGK